LKILLIAMPDTVDMLDPVMRLPNLALASLAASVGTGQHDVRVLDLVLVKEKLKKSLLSHLDAFKPDLVGLSAMTFQYGTLIRIASLIRARLPGVRLVAGGYHVTLMYREIAGETPDVPIDFMVRGEGEETFRELVGALAAPGGDFGAVRGLSWRDTSGEWRHNEPRPLTDLGSLPLPDRSARLETGFHLFRKRIDVTETSRGCPLQCNFCSIRKMYGQTFRRFPVERIISDLKRMRDSGVETVFFSDDNITYDREHLSAICRAIIDSGLTSMMYAIQASAYGIARNPDLVALMERANIRIINLGLESMDPAAIKFMKKATSIEINREAMRLLKKHRMGVNALFIIGFPDDTRESLRNSFRSLLSMRPDTLYCQFITPYPKTEIRDQLLAEGLVENADDFSRYDGYQCNVRTRHLSREELWSISAGEFAKALWPLVRHGNFFLKHFFRGFLSCESVVVLNLFRRLITGRSRDWRADL